MADLKKTPLFSLYQEGGAKTIDFGGWDLPVQFTSIKEEHEAVRTKAGLFDVSHMGEVEVSGPDALAFVQKITTNDASKLDVGQAQYSIMCYPDGGTVDDLLVYKLARDRYLLVINAANIEKDVDWMKQHIEGDMQLHNISDDTAQLALQGPLAEQVLQTLTDEDLSAIKSFRFRADVKIAGVQALVSRSGYTGEDGFELYTKPENAQTLWRKILEAGKGEVLPCGLGARDTLRFEARLPLYGQELSASISPIEAGVGFAVKTDKTVPFIGQDALKKQKEQGAPRKLVGVEMIGRGIPRTHYPVYAGEELIGEITTGTQSPTLKKNVGLALIKREFSEPGTQLHVEIRGKRIEAVIVPLPFYKRSK
ncbi:glycine cleavage system aminomethyltransferase GcvT [Aneurinibacillus sp. Ricciae_BoGa-3]|uniref:glycine cleavage system aminomethyltransferase GcvT n=1 Tax=Aneurinibacillus sp. Ricciae_BoGa-3 TaxID=3022697 RepID=UPI002342386E|nr:glycine cleavage system aminomethyltransferase GcvT [Aneurinibacillus sp. Ricciae_BoGa-3]WCK53341.1 glycine cleavage system aminomethyltransferase GcvT [Aneurinibacillus sp. Ricciae_BoGa-3]